MEKFVEEAKANRQRIRNTVRRLQKRWDQADQSVNALCREVDRIAAAYLVSYGCHKLSRRWRRRRMTSVCEPLPPVPEGKELQRVLELAERGDKRCMPQIRSLLADPDRALAWIDTLGNIANHVRHQLLNQAFGKNILLKDLTSRRMNDMQEAIAGPDATPLELLLAERITLTWFALNIAEHSAANLNGVDIPAADWRRRRLDSAAARFNAACTTLARIRRLARPRIQTLVNVAAANAQLNLGQ
jgi:hypothetical protein